MPWKRISTLQQIKSTSAAHSHTKSRQFLTIAVATPPGQRFVCLSCTYVLLVSEAQPTSGAHPSLRTDGRDNLKPTYFRPHKVMRHCDKTLMAWPKPFSETAWGQGFCRVKTNAIGSSEPVSLRGDTAWSFVYGYTGRSPIRAASIS